MTDNYSLLTVQNVQYWYWLSEPKRSEFDIGNFVDCPKDTVYRFMKASNLHIRDYSESGKVRFQKPEKYEAMIEIKRDPE